MWDRLVRASFDKGRQMEVLRMVPVESVHGDRSTAHYMLIIPGAVSAADNTCPGNTCIGRDRQQNHKHVLRLRLSCGNCVCQQNHNK